MVLPDEKQQQIYRYNDSFGDEMGQVCDKPKQVLEEE